MAEPQDMLQALLRKVARHLVPLTMAIIFISNIDRSKWVPCWPGPCAKGLGASGWGAAVGCKRPALRSSHCPTWRRELLRAE
jgi:hypothetical protein